MRVLVIPENPALDHYILKPIIKAMLEAVGRPRANVQTERDPKEVYFIPYVQERGLQNEPGNGRRTLGKQAAGRYTRVRQRCPEDIAALEDRIRAWISTPR